MCSSTKACKNNENSMTKKTTITEKEIDLLSQEKKLRSIPEDKITDKDLSTLEQIDDLKIDINERLEEEGQNPENLSLIIQKEKYRIRAKKRKEALEKLQKENEALKKGEGKEKEEENEDTQDWKQEASEIRAEARGYDSEEVEFAKVLQKGKGLKSLTEALELKEFKIFSEAHRQEKNDNDTTPKPSSRSIHVKTKPVGNMSRDEKKENYPEIVKKVIDRENRRNNL